MTNLSANQFPEVYAALGIDTGELGCIMLDLNPLVLSSYLPEGYEEDFYFSPYQEFVQGAPSEDKPHVTLLYGLLQKGSQIKPLVDIVLKDWKKPSSIKVESIGVFPGKEEDGTEYSCIVAHVKDDALNEANDRLRLLPHIDTFPTYRSHFTLAYVKAGATTEWLENLADLSGKLLSAADVNYGH